MPGVVKGFSETYGGLPFLIDRHFWVTGFMSGPLSSASEGLCTNRLVQARCHSTVFPPASRLS